MRAGLTVLGVLFLCNPQMGIWDILPDAVGFLCLYAALARGAYSNARLTEARHRAGVLCLIEIPKIFLGYSYITSTLRHPAVSGLISDENLSAKTILLAVLVVYFVAEIPLYFAFFRDLFEGIVSIGAFPALKKGRDEEFMIRFSRFFVVLRCVFSFLPELLYLTDMNYLVQDFDHLLVDIRLAHPVIAGVGCLLFLAIAIPWAVSMNRFFAAIRKEGKYTAACERIEQTDPDTVRRRKEYQRFSAGVVLFLCGCVFFFHLKFDNLYVVFHGMAPVFFLLSANRFRQILPVPRGLKLSMAVSAVLAFVSDVYSFIYTLTVFDRWGNGHDAIVNMTPARIRQQTMQYIVFALTAVAAAALLFSLYLWMRYFLGVLRKKQGDASLSDAIFERISFREDREKMKKRPKVLFVFFVIVCALLVLGELPYFAFYLSVIPVARFTLYAVVYLAAAFTLTDVLRAAKRMLNV